MTKQWQKSSNGPDWMDVRMMMVELGALHNCTVYLEISPVSTRYGPQVRTIATAVSNAPGSDLKACEESLAVYWPNVSNTTMDGSAYSLLVQLDNVLSAKWWQQGNFLLP